MIRSLWRILRDPDDADDACQEAVARIWKRWKQIKRHPNPQALILRTCVNCAYDVLRRRKRRRWENLAEHEESLLSGAADPAEELLKKEQRGQILAAIARLSRNQAAAVLMRLVEELPYREIAAALECSEATARTHFHRGRTRLALELPHVLETEELSHESS